MKTLLVLAEHPGLPDALSAALPADAYRVVHRASVDQAEPLLVHGVADACLLDLDLDKVQAVWLLEQVRRRTTRVPVIVYASNAAGEFQEQAFLLGASHVLAKPFRPQLLLAVLDRLWATAAPAPAFLPLLPAPAAPAPAPSPLATVDVAALRDFSGILTHSLDAEAMLRQFLLQLRDLLSINRAAIFLRPFATGFGAGATAQARQLRPAGSVGLSPDLISCLDLSLDRGLGAVVLRLGRIVRRNSPEALADPAVQQEFDSLGGQVAVPVMDRESVLGIAVFDTRITGEPLANHELELIFRLLEQLGLGLRNIRLHEQLAGNHAMLSDILRELASACIVVGRDLSILHANKTARRHFLRQEKRSGELEFVDLPQDLGARAYQVLQTGAAVPPFRFDAPGAAGVVFNGTVLPFDKQPDGLPGSVLILLDDQTQAEHLRRLEVEASELREFKKMADRVIAEVGNAITPVDTYRQLLFQVYKDPAVRPEFERTMGASCARILRLLEQMRCLLLPGGGADPVALTVLDEAQQEAVKYLKAVRPDAKHEFAPVRKPKKDVTLTGSRPDLKLALSEVFLNALQANHDDPKVTVHLRTEPAPDNKSVAVVEVTDNGPGFTEESARRATERFYTTRIPGVGLGLPVAKKVIEAHGGRLEIPPPKPGQGGLVRIYLPAA